MGASAAGVVMLMKEKHIVAAFREAGATSAAAAIVPAARGIGERRAFQRLKRRAVVREAESGRFYLDEPSWEALRHMRRRLALLIVIVVLAAAMVPLLRN